MGRLVVLCYINDRYTVFVRYSSPVNNYIVELFPRQLKPITAILGSFIERVEFILERVWLMRLILCRSFHKGLPFIVTNSDKLIIQSFKNV
jgi:hypothetical protein